MKTSTLRLGNRQVGEGQPCLVVAHVGAAHEGSPDTALRLIDAAFQAGADAIAFQVFRTDELLVRRHRERPEMEKLELSEKHWRRVLEAARASGLAVVAEVLDRPSRDVAAEAQVDALQASPGDLDHPDELRVDLDPMPGVDWPQIVDVALVARAVLEDHGLTPWPKTSGSRGFHIYARIAPHWPYPKVRY